MSSLQPPTRKRSRCESTNNNVNSQNNNCNTPNISLLSLPDEALNNIISYSMPQKECQVWEWIGILSYTCRSLRRFAITYAPTRIVLKDFKCYTRLSSSERSFDVRIEFLQSLRDCSWKRQHLKEFHVNNEAVLRMFERMRRTLGCSDIKSLLRTLLTAQASFPELEWLDIELQSDNIYEFGLVDEVSLQLIPDALPSLQKLCFCQCFKGGIREISPYQLRQFFTDLHTPLTSLSIYGSGWMTDAHVEAIMPIIGKNLVLLELVSCGTYDPESDYDTIFLSDNSLIPIAHHCKQLKSFSMARSDITCRGLEMVLCSNTGITTLNLSSNRRLDPRTIDIISRYLPRLEELRNYRPDPLAPAWLNDVGLIALVDAQLKESGGSGIFLKLIGLWPDYFNRELTVRGIVYAIEKGVKEIEINKSPLHDSIYGEIELGGVNLDNKSDVQLCQAHYRHYIDGSLYEREPVHKNWE